MKKNSQTQKSLRALTVFFLTLTLTPRSQAEVNTREGSFRSTWYDSIAATGDDPPSGIDRTYNSRSHHRGVFGFRWCSSLDQILNTSPDLSTNEKCDPPQKIGAINRLSAEQFEVTFQKHNLTITFDPKLLLITQIDDEQGKKLRYIYTGDELTTVVVAGRGQKNYHYDLSRNLTDFKDGDSKIIRLNYDLVYDRVTELDYGDGCIDHFDYDRKALGQNQKEFTTVTRSCRGAQRFSNTYEFTERKSPSDNAFRLIKFRIFNPLGTQTEVSYE